MISNPFRISIVADPWNQLEANVPEIHAAVFNRCCRAIEEVRRGRHTTSVLIHGQIGSGKTHLLGRLRLHLNSPAMAERSAGPLEAVFIAIRMQTGPGMIRRHLQRQFAVDLLRRSDQGETQLARLFLRRMEEVGFAGRSLYRWLSGERSSAHSLDDLGREMDELFDRIDPNEEITRDLQVVLKHLLLGGHKKDAAAWLRGETIPEPALGILGITEEEDREEQAEKIVVALCGLSGRNAPVIFCFDQIEALQIHPEDKAPLFAFGQMISSLHAKTGNVLIISCIQSSFLDLLKSSVRDADRDRLCEFGEVALNPLTWNEASRLVAARLDSLADLARERAAQPDSLWPLKEEAVKAEVGPAGITARKLLSKCAELFDVSQIKNAALPSLSTEDYLEQGLQRLLEHAVSENQPGQDLAHDLSLLLHLTGNPAARSSSDAERDVDLIINKGNDRIALSLCNQSTKSLWRRLDRLSARYDGAKNGKLVLLRDARLPIGENAKGTLLRREALLSKGARWVTLTAEAVAMLDALRQLLSDAKSGDLAKDGEAISAATVEQWLARNLSAVLPPLPKLLEEIIGESSVEPDLDLSERLVELLQTHHLLSVEDVAGLLQKDAALVAECALRYPDRFGSLNGPPGVLFQLTNEAIV